MLKPVWAAVAGVGLLGTVGVAGAVVVASSGGEEEVVQQAQTSTPTASAIGSPSPAPSLSQTPVVNLTPTPAPTASQPPIRPGWAEIVQPRSEKSEGFSFAHPDGWLVQPFDANAPGIGLTAVFWSWHEGKPPPGAIKLDVSILPIDGFSSDEQSSCHPAGSTSASMGEQAAWQKDSIPDPSHAPRITLIRSLATDRGSFRYCVIGFLFEGSDPAIFDDVVKSFRFRDS